MSQRSTQAYCFTFSKFLKIILPLSIIVFVNQSYQINWPTNPTNIWSLYLRFSHSLGCMYLYNVGNVAKKKKTLLKTETERDRRWIVVLYRDYSREKWRPSTSLGLWSKPVAESNSSGTDLLWLFRSCSISYKNNQNVKRNLKLKLTVTVLFIKHVITVHTSKVDSSRSSLISSSGLGRAWFIALAALETSGW